MNLPRAARRLTVALCAALTLASSARAPAADADRQAEVAARGAEVMPFSLAATTHVFTKTAGGALQRVVAKEPGDREQIRLIRRHLADIAQRFAHGDFSGPAHTHGAGMPGLAELSQAKPGELTVRYTEIAAGAEIEYSARSATLVTALHRWVDAQLSDHGADAQKGHEHPDDHAAHGT